MAILQPGMGSGSLGSHSHCRPTPGSSRAAGSPRAHRILAQGRGAKIRVFKMKRRKGYRRSQGHRQDYTEIRIDGISG